MTDWGGPVGLDFAQASGPSQADRHRKHFVLAGRGRFSFQIVQRAYVESPRPIPHKTPQRFREHGHAEDGWREVSPEVQGHGALP